MSSIIYNYMDDFASVSKGNLMKLDELSISKFKVVKQFNVKSRINSIDFSVNGNSMLTSSDDDTIRLFNCERGVKDHREIYSRKYGVDLIKFTHAANTAIHTSTKENDIIRYLSLHDNKYLRYFVGHEKRVVTLSMSPEGDTFLSGSLDNTVRFWNLQSEKVISKIHLPGCTTGPIANYDPEGLIFAVGYNNEILKLYDVRQPDKGPFSTIKYAQRGKWHSLKFSPNGKQMLITTDREELLVMDAFTGETLHRLQIGAQLQPGKALAYPCEASYSPDSQFIMTGSEDGSLHIWSASRGNKVCMLKPRTYPAEPVQCVKFNPKYMLIGSSCTKMSFWIPEESMYR